jgi:enoyl-CoA hydratase/carnithine racemase
MVELERQADGVTIARLARPPVNALDLELVQEIDSVVAGAIDAGA